MDIERFLAKERLHEPSACQDAPCLEVLQARQVLAKYTFTTTRASAV